MPRFNIQVGISFMGESGKVVANAFRDLAGQATRSLGQMERAAKGVQFALRAVATAAITREILQTITSYEQLRAQLETITGSAAKAQVAFSGIQQLAAKTPFSVEALTSAFIKLGAQGIAPTEQRLLSYGNTAAAMGKDVMMFIEAVADAQVGEFERLKEFGIKAKSEGDKVAFTFRGVTTTVGKNAAEIIAFLDQIGQKDFAGAMERQSRTLAGAWSNLKDTAAQLADQIGQGGLARELAALSGTMATTGAAGDGMARRLGQGLGFLVGSLKPAMDAVVGIANSILGVWGKVAQGVLSLAQKIATTAAGFQELIGAEEAAAMARHFADELGYATDVAREFASISFDQAGEAFLSMGDNWDRLIERALGAGPAAAAAAGSFDSVAASLDKVGTSADGAGDKLKKLTPLFLAPLETTRKNPLEKSIEKMIPNAERLGALLDELGMSTRDWAAEAAFVRQEYAAGRLTLEQMNRALAEIGNRSVEWGDRTKKQMETFAQFAEKSWGTFIENAQGATADFFYDILRNGKFSFEELGKGILDTFIRMIAELAARWLIGEKLMTKITQMEAAKRAAANAAANQAGGGGGGSGGGGGGWLGTIAKLFKGGGSGGSSGGFALSGSAVAGIAAFAVVAAMVAYRRHQRSERDKARFGTGAGVTGSGGSLSAGYSGRLGETGSQIAESMLGLLATIQETTGAFIQGVWQANVKIRNDKKAFVATFQGEMIGTFATAGEAIIAAAKAGFAKAQNLDPLVRQVIENFEGTDPEAFASAIQKVQEIADAISGVTEIEKTLQGLPAKISAIVGDLQLAGVAFGDAVVAAAKYGLTSFQSAWDAISGRQRSPAEEREIKERQRALLLAQLNLERARVAADYAALKARAAIVKGGAGLARQEIAIGVSRNRGLYSLMNNELAIMNAELGVYSQYVNERAELVEVEAQLFEAELEALGVVLAELDKLIAEVSVGKIRIGGAGGRGGGDIDVGGGRGGGGRSERQQFLDAWKEALKTLRDWVNGLKLSQFSPLTPQQRLAEAQAQVAAAVAAISGGGQAGLNALQNLPQLLEALLGEASGVYGTSTAGYQGIFAMVQELVASILGGSLPENVRQQIQAILGQGGGGGLPPANANSNTNAFRLRPQDLDPLTTRLDMANLHLAAIRSSGARTATATEAMLVELRQRTPAR